LSHGPEDLRGNPKAGLGMAAEKIRRVFLLAGDKVVPIALIPA